MDKVVEHARAAAPAAGGAEELVRADGIGVRRGGDWLIRDVGLSVRRGEIVTLIGPNGSGKTTTVRVVLGVMAADAGTVTRAPDLRVGYVPQRFQVDATLPFTVERLMTMTGPATDADIRRVLDDVGIPDLVQAPVQQLSGGEFQRAMLARALLRRPDLLVLDEPAQGVDFAGELALYELIKDIRDRVDCGVLLVSHDLHFVMAQTDQVVCLNHHVCCHGSPRSVAADPEYRRLFGPRAAEALAVYHHHHDHAHGPGGEVIPLDGDGCPVDGDGGHAHHHDHNHGHDHDREEPAIAPGREDADV